MVLTSTHSRPHLGAETANPGKVEAETVNPNKVIRYSSLKPWLLAIVLSLVLWAVLGWFLWWLFH
jgi:hypothetical protein